MNQNQQEPFELHRKAIDEKCAALIEQDSKLAELNNEISRTSAILEALENDREELNHSTKETLIVKNLSMDDYLQFKNQRAEIDHKIEYVKAQIEELEIKREALKETVFNLKTDFLDARNKVLFKLADQQLKAFMEEHKATLQRIKYYLVRSRKFDNHNNPEGRGEHNEDNVNNFLLYRLCASLNLENETLGDLAIPTLALESDYKPKSVMLKHKEAHLPQPLRGFNKLIAQIAE